MEQSPTHANGRTEAAPPRVPYDYSYVLLRLLLYASARPPAGADRDAAGCAVAVPPGSVPARQRCPGLSHHPPIASGPAQATRPPAVPSRLLQCPALPCAATAPPGREHVRGRGCSPPTRPPPGPSSYYTYAAAHGARRAPASRAPARLVRPAMQRHGVMGRVRACRAAVRAGGRRASVVRPSSPPHCARRPGPVPAPVTAR